MTDAAAPNPPAPPVSPGADGAPVNGLFGSSVAAATQSAAAMSAPESAGLAPESPSSFAASAAFPSGGVSPSRGPVLPAPAAPAPAPSGGWFSTLLLAVALVALVLSGLLWQRLDGIQQTLARRTADVEEAVEKAREAADEAVTHAQDLQARLSVAEVKLSEVTLQRVQLEELMLSVSRSRDDTLVLDIESGVRLAMQQAELTGSTQPILAALHAADRRIAKAAQPRLNPVQRAMARDVERIKASPVADLPLLASRLDELARAVDEWPLINTPPKRRAESNRPAKSRQPVMPTSAEPPSPDPAASPSDPTPVPSAVDATPSPAPSSPKTDRTAPTTVAHVANAPTDPTSAVTAGTDAITEPSLWQRVQASWGRLWATWTARVAADLRDLVRVSRIDQPDAVLLAPDQAVFMRENLKLRLLNARLSLLSRQVPEARADLQVVRTTLQKYFDPLAPLNRQAMQVLGDVLQSSRALELPRPDDTLAALATAAGGR